MPPENCLLCGQAFAADDMLEHLIVDHKVSHDVQIIQRWLPQNHQVTIDEYGYIIDAVPIQRERGAANLTATDTEQNPPNITNFQKYLWCKVCGQKILTGTFAIHLFREHRFAFVVYASLTPVLKK